MSNYEHKPGRGSFFPNDRASKQGDPVFKGSAKTPAGEDVWVTVWLEDPQNGRHAISLQPKQAQPQQGGYNKQAPQGQPNRGYNNQGGQGYGQSRPNY